MKRLTRSLAWVLALAMCFGLLAAPVSADSNMKYLYNETTPDSSNGLVAGEIEEVEADPAQGTHVLLGTGVYSAYSPSYVWGKKHSSETKPVVIDSAGRKYYAGDSASRFEQYGLYLDDYWVDGVHYYTPEGERTYARYGSADHFVLKDSVSGEYTTAYCVDNGQNAYNGNYYNIENLEDAGYYSDYHAKMIRAIALTGYWGQSSGTGSLEAMKNALRASGKFTEDELALVNDGVAMTATQYAIWHFANANDVISEGATNAQLEKVRKVIGIYWYDGGYSRLTDEQKPAADMVFKIGQYLISLDPESVENTTANTVITKDNFITNMGVLNAVKIDGHENNADTNDDNDAYTADVTFTMGVLPKSTDGDDLVVQIVDAENSVLAIGRISGTLQEGEVRLEGSNGTYTFKNLTLIEGTQKLQVKLAGHQELEQGVYLYNPVGGRRDSQTLIGVAEGTHTVDVTKEWDLKFAVNEPPERIINIHKQTPSGFALPGITFDFYCIADRDEYVSGKVELPEKGSDYIAANGLPALPDYTVVTDENGNATFNLTANNLPDGVYLVVEHEHPAIVKPVDPFYIVIPGTTEDGSGLVHVIDIKPKNDVRGDVDIEKDVIKLNNDLSNENAYDPHTWIISTTIPADIGIGKSFVISDTLDNRLDFLGNVRVTVENANGSIIAATLNEGKDYTLTVNDNDSVADKTSDSFTLSLTKAGMEKVASAATTGITHIRVYFDAQINANAEMGELIPNQAHLDYTNSVGMEFNPDSDEPEVYTGGARLKKVDANDNTVLLEGAEFKLYRKATEEEMADESIEKVHIGDMVEPMVPVLFFSNPELTGEKTDTTVSGEDGMVYFYGLVDGTYYAVETKAPEGYNLPGDPIEVTVSKTSHLDENVIVVENVSGTVLPETGGIGTAVFTIPGMILLMAAAVLLMRKPRFF